MAVVMIHSNVIHLVPKESMAAMDSIQRIFNIIPSLQILFVLSGYLFFLGCTVEHPFTKYNYQKKLRKRVRSLMYPYLIWCTIGYIFSVFCTHEKSLVMPPLEYVQLYAGEGWIGHPAGRALWYIKSLIVFALMSPLYYLLVRLLRHLTPWAVIILLPVVDIDFPFFSPCLLLGTYLAVYEISITKILKLADWRLCLSILVLGTLVSTFTSLGVTLLFVPAFVGLFRLAEKIKVSLGFAESSIFIYFSHLYISGSIRNFLVPRMPKGLFWYSLDTIITFLITSTLCYVVYLLLRRFCKPFLAMLTGDRV